MLSAFAISVYIYIVEGVFIITERGLVDHDLAHVRECNDEP